MYNFDFHNLLNSTEFEALCRDVLDIRENSLKFTTYKVGEDGGIDFRCTTNLKIIGQAKLYNPLSYKNLKAALTKEVDKCKKQNPSRYILGVSLSLSPKQADEILTLFEGYIKSEEDILDREKLNKYLGQNKYSYLLKTYSKLLVPGISQVEFLLENIVNRRHSNVTRRFLNDIQRHHKLYHNTAILNNCIRKLKENKIIILTGNPGVGKTTTAKMITQYMLSDEFDNLYVLESNHLKDIDELYEQNKKQLFVVDDFWGSQFSIEIKNRDYLRYFLRLLNDFNESNKHFLILTSRSYIIKDIINGADSDVVNSLNINNYTIDLDLFPNEDKARIFLKHIQFYLGRKELYLHLLENNTLKRIVNHSNYSPRHIEFFITKIANNDSLNVNTFYKEFFDYLENPGIYWNELFELQSDTSKLILILLLISSDPMSSIDLKNTFLNVQKQIRNELNLNIQPLEFDNELNTLEELFLKFEKRTSLEDLFLKVKEPNGRYHPLLVSFQSPGIKDYLLEYLRERIDFWAEILIKGAIFFNQINFIFTTPESSNSDIQDMESDTALWGQRIVLPQHFNKLLKKKIINQFHDLAFSTREKKEFAGEYFHYSSREAMKYWKLTVFSVLFDIHDDKNSDVREFIINEVLEDISKIEVNRELVHRDSMSQLPVLIRMIKPYTKINASKLISDYHDSISFVSHYDGLYNLKELFPVEYESYISPRIKEIRSAIKELIVDDIDYYLSEYMEDELHVLMSYLIEEVCNKFNVKLTNKFIDDIEEMAEMSTIISGRETERENSTLQENSYYDKPSQEDYPLDKIVQEYLSNNSIT